MYLIYLWKGVSIFQKATANKLFTLFPTVNTLTVGSVIRILLWSHDTPQDNEKSVLVTDDLLHGTPSCLITTKVLTHLPLS